MTLKLNGSTSGSVSLDAPASTTGGADVTLKLPIADGSAGQVLSTDGSGNLSWVTKEGPTFGTKTNFAATNSQDIAISAAGVNKIEIYFYEFSWSEDENWRVQLGDSGGIEETGYDSSQGYLSNNSASTTGASTVGFDTWAMGDDTIQWHGLITLTRFDGNTWFYNRWNLKDASHTDGTKYWGYGVKTLSGELTQVRFRHVNNDGSYPDSGSYRIVTYK